MGCCFGCPRSSSRRLPEGYEVWTFAELDELWEGVVPQDLGRIKPLACSYSVRRLPRPTTDVYLLQEAPEGEFYATDIPLYEHMFLVYNNQQARNLLTREPSAVFLPETMVFLRERQKQQWRHPATPDSTRPRQRRRCQQRRQHQQQITSHTPSTFFLEETRSRRTARARSRPASDSGTPSQNDSCPEETPPARKTNSQPVVGQCDHPSSGICNWCESADSQDDEPLLRLSD